MANYELDSVDLNVNIAGEASVTADISDAQPLNVTLGKAAEIDAGQAIMYIESGKAEIAAAVNSGLAQITTVAADRDLANLTAAGEAKFDAKQDVISDLTTIRSGASAGATAVQPADLATVATSGSYTDLANTPSIPAAQIQSDWTQATTTAVDYIKNKPTLATVATSGAYSDLSGTPSLATVATSGSYNDLSNKPDLSGYAADNAVVHLAGTETITGAKTFQDQTVTLKNTNVVYSTVPASGQYTFVYFKDANDDMYSQIYSARWSGNGGGGLVFSAKNTSGATADISLCYQANGSFYATAPNFWPGTDNTYTLGSSSLRWKQLYAATSTINTSDERVKQGIESVPDAVLDAWGEVEFYRYKFNDAVAEKGFDKARYHTGVVAQRIMQVFGEHGLNAFDYGLLCYDEWEAGEAITGENGEIIRPAQEAGNRYAVRYEECLCMEAAYQRRRADRIEARLAALEARL